jgi:hypothetical protein
MLLLRYDRAWNHFRANFSPHVHPNLEIYCDGAESGNVMMGSTDELGHGEFM